MKTSIRPILMSGFILLGLAVSAPAQVAPSVPDAPPAVTKGRVLVLRNEATRTGDIERVGDQYRIRHLIGETWLPADQVLQLCATLDDAYQLLRSRANLNDPDERLRLSEWCRQHELRTQALNEIREAVNLRPKDPRYLRILNHLQTADTPPRPKPVVTSEPSAPRVEVSAEAVSQFAVRVQPILMNACVRCHNSGRGGQFRLTCALGEGTRDRRTMEKNLAAALAEVNPREPQISRLLTKAVCIHGRDMDQAPLTGRDTVAFRTIEQWVLRTVANNPHLLERAVASAGPGSQATATPPPPASEKGEKRWGVDREPARRPPPAPEKVPTPATPASATTPSPAPQASPATAVPAPTKPMPLPTGVPKSPDPVDPDGFNREFHPNRQEPAGTRDGQGNGR